MNSLWLDTVSLPDFPALRRPLQTEVLVVGGGLTGLLCAYLLQQQGVDCVLLEARGLCQGVTGHTTAKLSLQHGLLYQKLYRRLGAEGAALYLRAQQEALRAYAALCARFPCDYTPQTAWLYSRSDRAALEREQAVLTRLGATARLQDHAPLPFPIVGALGMDGQAQFHPLRFAAALCRDLQIYCHSPVHSAEEGIAHTAVGDIRARHIILATHFPIGRWRGAYFLRQHQYRAQVLALSGVQPPPGMYLGTAADDFSLRAAGELLLLGGGGGRTGREQSPETLWATARRWYPRAELRAHWAAQDCIPLDDLPYIGPASPRTPHFYVATGYNKWGMTSSMVAARLLTDRILRRPNPCAALFAPPRSLLHPRLAGNLLSATIHLLRPSRPRCPHMGCALHWNAAEQCWECPCHGSRFDAEGNVLDAPAAHGLRR